MRKSYNARGDWRRLQQCKDYFKTLKTTSIYQIIIWKTPFQCKKDAYPICNCSLLYPSLEFLMSFRVRFLTRAYPGISWEKITLEKEYLRPLWPPLGRENNQRRRTKKTRTSEKNKFNKKQQPSFAFRDIHLHFSSRKQLWITKFEFIVYMLTTKNFVFCFCLTVIPV